MFADVFVRVCVCRQKGDRKRRHHTSDDGDVVSALQSKHKSTFASNAKCKMLQRRIPLTSFLSPLPPPPNAVDRIIATAESARAAALRGKDRGLSLSPPPPPVAASAAPTPPTLTLPRPSPVLVLSPLTSPPAACARAAAAGTSVITRIRAASADSAVLILFPLLLPLLKGS